MFQFVTLSTVRLIFTIIIDYHCLLASVTFNDLERRNNLYFELLRRIR